MVQFHLAREEKQFISKENLIALSIMLSGVYIAQRLMQTTTKFRRAVQSIEPTVEPEIGHQTSSTKKPVFKALHTVPTMCMTW